jgi:hypothetical protein
MSGLATQCITEATPLLEWADLSVYNWPTPLGRRE